MRFYCKYLILIRHGETESFEKERILTGVGKTQIKKSAQKLIKECPGKLIILTSKTKRAIQSGKILSRILNAPMKHCDLRFGNINNLKDLINRNEALGVRPAKTVLGINDCTLKKSKVETKKDFVDRILRLIAKYSDLETVILVSHEISLEVFLYNQNVFEIKNKTFKKYFNYGDYAILKDRDMV